MSTYSLFCPCSCPRLEPVGEEEPVSSDAQGSSQSTVKEQHQERNLNQELFPPIRHHLDLHNISTSFPSKSPTSSTLISPPISGAETFSGNNTPITIPSPSPFPSPVSAVAPNKRPAEEEAEERPAKKIRCDSPVDLAHHFTSQDRDADDEGSDSADTPSGSEEKDSPISAPAHIPTRVPGKWDFSRTAKEEGYIYNPRKSLIDLTPRSTTDETHETDEAYEFGDSDEVDETDDSESDFGFTPSPSLSPTTPATTTDP
ncbi:hypothetical protein SBOR_1490 [Sclerotinia borealis F-4128]|uniref:Uncharacterized protein n=1 Tax=Sclerotinia borealis (strain F-4128) TaxID=1432307 RepID=W9CQI4_SCLBF|nr:hypothetical protein SBOR_1490 [Sclerotinia borealis F-4128]